MSSIRRELDGHESLEILDEGDAVVFVGPRVRRVDAPFVVLAGHVDTVPVAGAQMPAAMRATRSSAGGPRHEGGARGDAGARGRGRVGAGCERHRCGVPLLRARGAARSTRARCCPCSSGARSPSTIELAVVMEPTDNAIEVGCLGQPERRRHRGGTRRTQRPALAGRERDPCGDRGAGPARRSSRP